MAYGVKYRGIANSLDGSTYTVEILENGYSGSVIPIVLSKPAFTVYWGQRGDEVYTPIRPSSAEIMVFDPSKTLQADLLNADEEKFRLHIKKGSGDYWLGKIVMDGFQNALNLVPASIKITAIDGLGQLDGLDFDDTTRVSIVQCAADLLAQIGLGLNIRFASDWFTPDIAADQDPLHEIYTERIAERGDQDALLSAKAVFEEYLTRFGLQLHQSGGIWRITQRELLGGSGFTYFEYDSTGAFIASDIEIPSVTMTADAQYGKRLKDGQGTFKPAYQTTTSIYMPKPGSGALVPNGSFEDWGPYTEPADVPTSWERSEYLQVTRNGVAMDGVYSCELPSYYDLNNGYPTGYVKADCGIISGASQLQIRIGACLLRNPLKPDFGSTAARKVYFKILFGNYYLRRAGDGSLSWVLQGQGGQYDDMILFQNVGIRPDDPWAGDAIVTPDLPVPVGAISVYLYQVVESDFTFGQESTTATIVGNLWDNIRIDQLILGETATVTGTKTVSNSVVLSNTVNRDSVQFMIGDGPDSRTPSRLTIGATTLTGNWKRGAYSGQDPTGESIDAMCSESWLRAQKQTLEIHSASYAAHASAGALIEAHNVLVIGTKRYAFTYLERDLIAGHSTGEWIEVRADDDDMLTTVEAIVQDNGTNVVNQDIQFGDGVLVGSQTFAAGFRGSGWKIEKIGNRYKCTIDDLDVRGSMSVAELLFSQVRATNGSLWISSTGKVKAIIKLS